MLNSDEIRGQIAKKGLSQRKLAKILGITEKTFYVKMKDGVFRTDELEEMAKVLGVSRANIGTFFCDDPARQEVI